MESPGHVRNQSLAQFFTKRNNNHVGVFSVNMSWYNHEIALIYVEWVWRHLRGFGMNVFSLGSWTPVLFWTYLQHVSTTEDVVQILKFIPIIARIYLFFSVKTVNGPYLYPSVHGVRMFQWYLTHLGLRIDGQLVGPMCYHLCRHGVTWRSSDTGVPRSRKS